MEKEIAEIKIGILAPGFCLYSHSGEEINLADYLGKSIVVLFFVREFN